jgi:hypothetical protein
MTGVLILVLVVLGLALFLLPSIIAFRRDHAYRWIILAINLVLGCSGLGWIAAFVWAVFPSERSLADPIVGNVTGTGQRTAGTTFGEFDRDRAAAAPPRGSAESLAMLERLAALFERGLISREEFERKKADLL